MAENKRIGVAHETKRDTAHLGALANRTVEQKFMGDFQISEPLQKVLAPFTAPVDLERLSVEHLQRRKVNLGQLFANQEFQKWIDERCKQSAELRALQKKVAGDENEEQLRENISELEALLKTNGFNAMVQAASNRMLEQKQAMQKDLQNIDPTYAAFFELACSASLGMTCWALAIKEVWEVEGKGMDWSLASGFLATGVLEAVNAVYRFREAAALWEKDKVAASIKITAGLNSLLASLALTCNALNITFAKLGPTGEAADKLGWFFKHVSDNNGIIFPAVFMIGAVLSLVSFGTDCHKFANGKMTEKEFRESCGATTINTGKSLAVVFAGGFGLSNPIGWAVLGSFILCAVINYVLKKNNLPTINEMIGTVLHKLGQVIGQCFGYGGSAPDSDRKPLLNTTAQSDSKYGAVVREGKLAPADNAAPDAYTSTQAAAPKKLVQSPDDEAEDDAAAVMHPVHS